MYDFDILICIVGQVEDDDSKSGDRREASEEIKKSKDSRTSSVPSSSSFLSTAVPTTIFLTF